VRTRRRHHPTPTKALQNTIQTADLLRHNGGVLSACGGLDDMVIAKLLGQRQLGHVECVAEP
jgi:hypothetical protein